MKVFEGKIFGLGVSFLLMVCLSLKMGLFKLCIVVKFKWRKFFVVLVV